MRLSTKIVYEICIKLNVNPKYMNALYKGMKIEMEHGYINKQTNVTNNSLLKTAKIALAHLQEYPDYYERLERMEKQAKNFWKNKSKTELFAHDIIT